VAATERPTRTNGHRPVVPIRIDDVRIGDEHIRRKYRRQRVDHVVH